MNVAVILAGGVGSRLGLDIPKQFMKIAGKTILEHTVETFHNHVHIDEIAVVINGNYVHDLEKMVLKNHWIKVKKILVGGNERYESSLIAIEAYKKLSKQININLIFHDAVRPLVSIKIIDDVVKALNKYKAVDVAVPSVDTIINIDSNKKYIVDIPDRNFLYRGQTPQGFRYDVIAEAYDRALKDKMIYTTDDCGVVKKYLPDIKIFVVPGEEQNIKLTYPEDIYLIEKLFQIKRTIVDASIRLNQLNDKVIVIFGGNSGIGLDIRNIANSYGAKCYSFSRSTTNTDISDINKIDEALKYVCDKESKIDYIVNTAAILIREPFMHMEYELIKKIIDINFEGMVNVSKASHKYLCDSKGALLHFTSSSYTRGRANYALYSASKAATVNFVQAIAEEWRQDNIRVNCINPQRTKTPMRFYNFGMEDESTLLKSQDVAIVALKTLLGNYTGTIVDVKLSQYKNNKFKDGLL